MDGTRRADDSNLVSYAHGLFRGEFVTALNRTLAAAYAFGWIWWGQGLLFRSGGRAYANPVFNGVFTAAHPAVWGMAFWFAGCLMLLTALTARGILFLWAMVASVGILLGWSVGIVTYAVIDDDAVLTSGAVALYTLAFTGLAGMAFSPRPLDFRAEILERDESGVLVPLRPIERRTG